MQNEKIKLLYDKLKLKYSTAKDIKNQKILWKIEHSLNLMYPYEFIHDTKGIPNYNIKSIVLDTYSNDLNIIRKYKRAEYLRDKYMAQSSLRELPDAYTKNLELLGQKEKEYFDKWLNEGELVKSKSIFLFNECYKIVNAEVARRKRLRQRVERIMSTGQTYFITLTFAEDTLKNTDAQTRRRYVTRFLKTVATDYVGNIDFGKLKGREHYHAVISSDKLNDIKYVYTKRYGYMCIETPVFDEWSKLGYYSIKSCGTSETDKKKLAAYTAKLVNHAVKETTKRNALIYSR